MDVMRPQSGYLEPVRRHTGVDKRRRGWRRRCELVVLYSRQLGHDFTSTHLPQIEHVAELCVAVEAQHLRLFRDEHVDVASLTKLENLLRRAQRELGLTDQARPRKPIGRAPKPARIKRPPSLAELMAKP
jgi:hypothetical protein